jgi:hypothetical protein
VGYKLTIACCSEHLHGSLAEQVIKVSDIIRDVTSQHSMHLGSFGTIVNLCGFKRKNFVTVCTAGFDTLVASDRLS